MLAIADADIRHVRNESEPPALTKHKIRDKSCATRRRVYLPRSTQNTEDGRAVKLRRRVWLFA